MVNETKGKDERKKEFNDWGEWLLELRRLSMADLIVSLKVTATDISFVSSMALGREDVDDPDEDHGKLIRDYKLDVENFAPIDETKVEDHYIG